MQQKGSQVLVPSFILSSHLYILCGHRSIHCRDYQTHLSYRAQLMETFRVAIDSVSLQHPWVPDAPIIPCSTHGNISCIHSCRSQKRAFFPSWSYPISRCWHWLGVLELMMTLLAVLTKNAVNHYRCVHSHFDTIRFWTLQMPDLK